MKRVHVLVSRFEDSAENKDALTSSNYSMLNKELEFSEALSNGEYLVFHRDYKSNNKLDDDNRRAVL